MCAYAKSPLSRHLRVCVQRDLTGVSEVSDIQNCRLTRGGIVAAALVEGHLGQRSSCSPPRHQQRAYYKQTRTPHDVKGMILHCCFRLFVKLFLLWFSIGVTISQGAKRQLNTKKGDCAYTLTKGLCTPLAREWRLMNGAERCARTRQDIHSNNDSGPFSLCPVHPWFARSHAVGG